MKPEDFVIYVIELLGIKTESQFAIDDMISDISSIPPAKLPMFKEFVKSSIGKAQYEYKTGIQKFQVILRDFEIETRPKLSTKAYARVENYAMYLFKKTCKLFNHINWEIEAKGRNIHEVKYEETKSGTELYYTKADVIYLKKLGDVAVISNLVRRSPEKLKSELIKIIVADTLIKYDPNNQIENKSEDRKILEQIKERRTA